MVVAGLYETNLSTSSYDFLGTSNSDGLGSGNVEIDINSINSVVDNNQNVYHLSLLFTNGGSDYDFHGMTINYTYTQPY